jgi:hypothetical protein
MVFGNGGVVCSHLEGTMDDYSYMMLRCFRADHGALDGPLRVAGAAAGLSCNLHVPCLRFDLGVLVVVTLLVCAGCV